MKAIWLVALLLIACRGDTPNEERKLPRLHPAPFQLPADLHVPLVVDGTPAGEIDAARLQARPPDFRDDERHAWRLDTLLQPELRTGRARISGVRAGGAAVVVQVPADGPVPVLLVNRRGQTLITLLDPADPFPRFHGQGGRLARPPQPNLQAIIERIEIETLP
jgi:hypothetical protein